MSEHRDVTAFATSIIVTRGPRTMFINGRLQPAYKWCEEFGHQMTGRECTRCGGEKVIVSE